MSRQLRERMLRLSESLWLAKREAASWRYLMRWATGYFYLEV